MSGSFRSWYNAVYSDLFDDGRGVMHRVARGYDPRIQVSSMGYCTGPSGLLPMTFFIIVYNFLTASCFFFQLKLN